MTGPLAATDAGGTSRPHRAFKLQEYVGELAERPPINEVPEIDRGAGYEVYDPLGQKIGSAKEVFVNRNEEPEYVRVRIGFFGQKSVLIPVQFAEVDDERRNLVLK